MFYPVVIHKGPDSDYGVTVPDLPGCISAGETYEEALNQVKEAMELHLECLLDDDEPLPQPRPIELHQINSDYQGGTWALVEVNTDALMGPVERINITIPRRALHKIDAATQQAGMNRSQYLTQSGLAGSQRAEDRKPV